MSPSDRDPFHGLAPTRPPAELRQRTLRAARAADARGGPIDVWTRLLAGPRARLLWAGTIVLLLAANILVATSDRTRRAAGAKPATTAHRWQSLDPEIVQLTRLDASQRARRRTATGVAINEMEQALESLERTSER